MSDMLKAALEFAQRGWPVFPCSPEDKRPLTVNGFKSATLDPKRIGVFWRGRSDAMIGVPTGHRTKTFVLDINPPAGHSIPGCCRVIEAAIGGLPITQWTMTPNGAHIWFKMPDDVEIRNRGPLLGGAIDCVRGEGGYVIVPPSVRASGLQYCWAEHEHAVIAEAPVGLVELVRPQ